MGIKAKQKKRVERRKKMRAAKESRRLAYMAKVKAGNNSKRKQIASKRGDGKLVRDTREESEALFPRVSPNRYHELH